MLRDATGQSEHSLADGAGEKAGGWGREQGDVEVPGETKPREAPRAEQPVVMQVEAERVEYYRGLGDAELYQAMSMKMMGMRGDPDVQAMMTTLSQHPELSQMGS